MRPAPCCCAMRCKARASWRRQRGPISSPSPRSPRCPLRRTGLGHRRTRCSQLPRRSFRARSTDALEENCNLTSEQLSSKEAVINESDLLGSRPLHWYTGRAPHDAPGLEQSTGVIHSIPLLNLSSCTRIKFQEYFDNTWTLTETLYSSLQGSESFYVPPPHNLR